MNTPHAEKSSKYKQAEIDYYSKLPAEDRRWNRTKPFGKLSAESQRLFRDFSNILQVLDLPLSSRILDLGTGSGWLALFLSKFGYEIVGVDIAPDMIAIARKRAAEEKINNVQFVVGDIENSDSFEACQFDGILCYSTLHHCQNEQLVLQNCYKWLKPSGVMLLVEPNRLHPFKHKSREAVQKYGVTEKGYRPATLKKLLKKSGFRSISQFYPSPPAYGTSPRDLLKHILQPIIQRAITKHFQVPVWLLAYK